MSPIAMTVILAVTLSALTYSLNRRWQLMKAATAPADRSDQVPKRLWVTIKYALGQYKMADYPLAGVAHIAIFAGFLVLLLRSLMLWGRAFSPDFNLWILGPIPVLGLPLGHLYDFAKEFAAIIVLAGCGVFVYLRVVVKEKRMTLHWEGLLILAIIIVMMLMDILYDGAMFALRNTYDSMGCDILTKSDVSAALLQPGAQSCYAVAKVIAPIALAPSPEGVMWFAPVSSALALVFRGLSANALVVLAHVGFWSHASLVLIFANILPYTKHFHIFTVFPNVFTTNLTPPGRLEPMAVSSDELMELVGNAAEQDDPKQVRVGVARVEHLSWKNVLDLYTCTECGRCSDNCPAYATGKLLSPKDLTLRLRSVLYDNEKMFVQGIRQLDQAHDEPHEAMNNTCDLSDSIGSHNPSVHGEPHYPNNPVPEIDCKYNKIDLVPALIDPKIFWACTTCRACEQFCPVMISYVDKIVELRRHQVLIEGEFPHELAKPFDAMETNGNPWNLSRLDRDAWAEGLGVTTMKHKPDAKVLYWVGCAASYDDRSKKVARAMVRLLQAAGVDFAILGQEESCTGDAARRAGNEYLFATLAEKNIEILNGYKEQGGIETIVTACPHCFNTLAHEYPDFGGNYHVVHHTEFLLKLLHDKKLKPKHEMKQRIVYHDSCYLGRYNEIYDAPREALKYVPGLQLVEAQNACRKKGMCCGAGGAQMWMEEQNKDRINVKRTLQLLATEPDTIATACPFCMTMISDGMKDQDAHEQIHQLDIAEILEQSCLSEG